MDDEELLSLVADERKQSIGFNHDEELSSERQRALQYAKGEMKDMPTLFNRSKAVSTDIADAVETVLPDLMEIFTGGDDVAVFQPQGQDDEDKAKQETDYVNHVVFQENEGFLALYSIVKDALTVKTGIAKWWWEERPTCDEQKFQDQDEDTVKVIAQEQEGEIVDLVRDEQTGLYAFTLRNEGKDGTLKIKAVPPEDFTVARDTVSLRETTYCAMRSRPRAQDLIRDGYEQDKVDKLPASTRTGGDGVEEARDTAAEHDVQPTNSSKLRIVEVVEHYIRIDDTIWRVLTGDNEAVLIDKTEVDAIPFAAITPYLIPHRFYGQSIADKLFEIQRIKTALMRMFLDSGYFAMNQRFEVSEDASNDFTITDLLRNEPGVPVRSRTGEAVRPIMAGSINFPALEALEYMSTVSEQRTGVVRNAQGLNPDTLHDTAKGAMALMGAAQKRIRLVARIFAETGLKDLFLGVHATLRQHATKAATVRLRGKWVEVDPSTWGMRKDMSIELGVGAGGREHELIMMGQASQAMEQIVTMQGGPTGPIVTEANVYAFAKRMFERGFGFKSADAYLSDPTQAQAAPQQPPPPDPKMAEVQGRLQLAKDEQDVRLSMDQKKAQDDAALGRYKADLEHQRATVKQASDIELKRQTVQAEIDLKGQQLAAEMALKEKQMAGQHVLATQQAEHGAAMKEREVSAAIGEPVQPGGEPG
jgi:hypothetical protein